MRNIHYFLTVFLLSFFAQSGFSQNFTFGHLTINQELSNNTIYAIAEDRDGFLWFGSRDGLNKYDGYEFTVFKSDPTDSLSLPGNNIQALFAHPNGDLWIGLRQAGLCILDRATQQFRVNPFSAIYDDWRSVSVQAIFRDSRGYMWLGTSGRGVVRIDPEGKNFEYFGPEVQDPKRRLLDHSCFSFAEDKNGNVWLGTNDNHVHCYLPASDSIMVIGNDPGRGIDLYSYTKSLAIKNDVLWIGTEGNGVIRYDLARREYLGKALGNYLVKDVVPYKNMILISTDGDGLFYSKDEGRSFQAVQSSPNLKSLNTDALYDLYVDSRDNVWIGSFNGGLNVYVPNKNEFLTHPQLSGNIESPGSQSALTFLEDREGYIWIGKDGGGLVRFHPGNRSYTAFRAEPPRPGAISSDVVTSIYEDRKGRFWVGTFSRGLDLFDPRRGKLENFRQRPGDSTSISNDNVWSVIEDNKGNLWIGTLGGGLNRFDVEKKKFYRYTPDTNIPPRPGRLFDWNIRVLLADGQDNLWIGTEFGGLNKRDAATGRFSHWLANTSDSTALQSNFILCLHLDRRGRLWVGTEGGGLHLMVKEGVFKNYAIKDGLPSNVINAIEEDDSGTLWISTNSGLAALNPETGMVATFDQHDGLQSNQFNPGASLRTRKGEFYFGGVLGVNSFIPENIVVDSLPAKVVFTDFKLFNKSLPASACGPLNERPEIALRYTDNVFTIEFAALEFNNPAKYQYAYRLRGFEEEWNVVNAKQRRATYTNLNGGEYTFQVKASKSKGVWSKEPIELVIRVSPPFWKTWWFRAIVTLLVLSAIVAFLVFLDSKRMEAHQKRLMKAEQEILKLRNERLSEEVKEKNAQLSAALLQTAHKNTSLDKLKKQLLDIGRDKTADATQKKEIRQLVRKIDSELSSEDYWEQFQLNFDQVHQQFSQLLHLRHPELTPNEIRLCCLLRINMTNREIAAIQNTSLSAVEKSKYRLKKKLGLDREADLNAYVLGIV
jgi:ligand-binding sensor domain-containing protein/DNA-binding CsgD family transcriptional regulator